MRSIPRFLMYDYFIQSLSRELKKEPYHYSKTEFDTALYHYKMDLL